MPKITPAQRKALELVAGPECGGVNHMHSWPMSVKDVTVHSLRRRGLLHVGICGINMAQAVYPATKCDWLAPEAKKVVGL